MLIFFLLHCLKTSNCATFSPSFSHTVTCKFCIIDVIIITHVTFQTTDKSKGKVDKSHMLYCTANASYPIEFISCGNLINDDGFTHPSRNIDSFVFIIVCEGTLHINQNGNNLDICENESLLLFPHQTHFGYKPSKGKLSYYWVHFYMTDPNYTIYNKSTLLRYNEDLNNHLLPPPTPSPHNNFLIPEHGKLSAEKRSILLFVQLLDISKRDNYQATWRCRYALNLLLLEFTSESFLSNDLIEDKIPNQVMNIIEYIRTHYNESITVESLAEQYNYHPTYLTALVKKYTGYPVSSYVNRFRISIAKNILCVRNTLSIQDIAYMCGFTDDKYFMRLFKKIEGITPTQYRNAFQAKKINKQ